MIAPSPLLKYQRLQCLFGMKGLPLNEFCFLNAPESDLGRRELVHWGQVLVVPPKPQHSHLSNGYSNSWHVHKMPCCKG